MYIRVCARLRVPFYIIHTAWATVLLFVTKGNTRASVSGTAIVQSRFFVVCPIERQRLLHRCEILVFYIFLYPISHLCSLLWDVNDKSKALLIKTNQFIINEV